MVNLLTPLRIKGLTLRNRVVMPPMGTNLATAEGAVSETLIEHYVRRSRAVGLLIIEHSYISRDGKLNEKQLGIYNDDLVVGLEQLSSRIHALGTPVVIQLNHAGRAARQETTGMDLVAPSSFGNARALRIDEIEELVEAFAGAAERAMNAGFDGVEIHGAHGFLLNQFFSPLGNRRSDAYGGSNANRMRFPLEVVERVKERVRGRLVLYRVGSDDLDPAGVTIEDSMSFAMQLQATGVDMLDVSGGLCGSRPQRLQGTQGYFIPQAQRIKEVVDIPVIGVGGITEPAYANRVIEERRVDLVAVGRALMKDSEWATKAIETIRAMRPE